MPAQRTNKKLIPYARRLREARQKVNLRPHDVSLITGLSEYKINSWECAYSRPDIDGLKILAELYAMDFNWFYTGSEQGYTRKDVDG